MQHLIEKSWAKVMAEEFEKDYFKRLEEFISSERSNYHVYPAPTKIFSAFHLTPFADVKVVIIGQDPYHGKLQANGLAFSVDETIKIPPSLKNIFKEYSADLNLPIPKNGNLETWAKRGVLLLNTTLTVRENNPGSHFGRGWELFTDAIIRQISEQKTNVVFFLWGKFAQSKASFIDGTKHLVLATTHPSPFSAHKGFIGCRHFSRANHYLSQGGSTSIDWQLQP